MNTINAEQNIIKKEIKGYNLSKKRVKHYCEIDKYTLYNERNDEKKIGNIYINYGNNHYQILSSNNKIKKKGNNIGFEDPRVFSYKNNNYILVNAIGINSIRNMYLINIEKKSVVQLKVINNNHMNTIDQKNWSPYIYNNKLYFIYSFMPLVILETINIEDGYVKLVKGNEEDQSNLNKNNDDKIFGSTPLIPYQDGNYICFTHTRNPYLAVPLIYNPFTMKIIKIGNKLLFDYPKESQTKKNNWKNVQFAYDIKKDKDIYKLYIEFRNKCSGILYIKENDIYNFF